MKFTLYEGGVRNVGALWSPLLRKKNYVNKNVIHITDWLPTLYAAAGGRPQDLGAVDGKNMWPSLSSMFDISRPSAADTVLLNIDESLNYDGIMTRDGRFKLLNGKYFY